MSVKLGIIGGGVMAEAILSRLLAQQLYYPDNVLVSEPQAPRREILAQKYRVKVTSDNRQTAASASEVLLLAIKPQVFKTVAAELAPESGGNRQLTQQLPVVVSILAGMPLSQLESAFGRQPVIRVMPNTLATVGAGITAIATGSTVKSEQIAKTKAIFEAVGEVVEVPEHLMDAITALSGSGPA
ncbi:MAG: NAD(P)-binding domain-containing protein, partial [Symploca sp. SIO1C4]|nr:NAD(P)-binding domain-containing protein [Symploca sp. SIO1C4]